MSFLLRSRLTDAFGFSGVYDLRGPLTDGSCLSALVERNPSGRSAVDYLPDAAPGSFA